LLGGRPADRDELVPLDLVDHAAEGKNLHILGESVDVREERLGVDPTLPRRHRDALPRGLLERVVQLGVREPLALLADEDLALSLALAALLDRVVVVVDGGAHVGLYRSLVVAGRAAAGDGLEVLDLLERRVDLAEHGPILQALRRDVHQRRHVRPLEEREDDGGEELGWLGGDVVADVARKLLKVLGEFDVAVEVLGADGLNEPVHQHRRGCFLLDDAVFLVERLERPGSPAHVKRADVAEELLRDRDVDRCDDQLVELLLQGCTEHDDLAARRRAVRLESRRRVRLAGPSLLLLLLLGGGRRLRLLLRIVALLGEASALPDGAGSERLEQVRLVAGLHEALRQVALLDRDARLRQHAFPEELHELRVPRRDTSLEERHELAILGLGSRELRPALAGGAAAGCLVVLRHPLSEVMHSGACRVHNL
ncbi:hypothetical protein T484DRAFT_3646332, partial [Baffinella frigidus]